MPFLTGNPPVKRRKSDMAKKTRRYFIVGLFVTMGFLIATVAVIWISASKYFERGAMYVTFFDESVQGLSKDSEVKYQGVKVGRVEDIRIAPDNKTVAVYMMINLRDEKRDDLPERVVAQMGMTGITGLMFINLVPRQPDEPDLSPKIDFATEYPVIPSKPSEISQILTGVRELVENLKQADIDGTLDQIKGSFKEVQDFLKQKEIKDILAKADSAVGYLKDTLKRVDKSIAAGKLDDVLAEAGTAFKEVGSLMEGVNSDLRQSKIPETVKKARLTLNEAQVLMENLRRTSETLDLLIERLYERPPDVFFGKPPKARWNEKPGKAKR
jgi:phospholipid/cholesterol/gamma-HCH transport system substrate-binding protein